LEGVRTFIAQTRKSEATNLLLFRKPEEKRPIERPRCRWVDNIKIDFVVIGRSSMDCIGLGQDTDKQTAVIILRVPDNAGKFLSGCTTTGLSSSARVPFSRLYSPSVGPWPPFQFPIPLHSR
jgi:hypothetical protein